MKQALFCLMICLISMTSFAEKQPPSNSVSLAMALGHAFKNHATSSNIVKYRSLATTYGGQDVSNQTFFNSRVIA